MCINSRYTPGIDSINGHYSIKEVAKMALRLEELGLSIKNGFHYSDSGLILLNKSNLLLGTAFLLRIPAKNVTDVIYFKPAGEINWSYCALN